MRVLWRSALSNLVGPYAGFCETRFIKPILEPLMIEALPSAAFSVRALDLDRYEITPALSGVQWEQFTTALQRDGRVWLQPLPA
jgi:hypothetical protein